MKKAAVLVIVLLLGLMIVPAVNAGVWDWIVKIFRLGETREAATEEAYEMGASSNYAAASLNLRGSTYKLESVSDITTNDFTIKADMNADGSFGSSYSVNFIDQENTVIPQNAFFFLKGYGVFEYLGADAPGSGNTATLGPLKIRFKDLKTNQNVEYAISSPCQTCHVDTALNLGGQTYKIQSASDCNSDDFSIKVDMDTSGTIGDFAFASNFVGSECLIISKGQFFNLKDDGQIQYAMADAYTKSTPKIRFTDNLTVMDYSVPSSISSNYINDIKTMGYTYRIENASDAGLDDFNIRVDMNHDGNLNTLVTATPIISESTTINKNDYFIIKGYGLIQYLGADAVTKSSPKMKFKDMETGNTIEISLTPCDLTNIGVNINAGGNSYKVIAPSGSANYNFPIKVDMDHSSTIGDYGITVIDSEANTIGKDNYFFIKNYGIIKYLGADNSLTTNAKMKFFDEQYQSNVDVAYQVLTLTPSTGTPPSAQPAPPSPTPVTQPCNGCLSSGKCYSYGTRVGSKYCATNGQMANQKSSFARCSNNYECSSNKCTNNYCAMAWSNPFGRR